MKNKSQNRRRAGQSSSVVKTSQKHDVNVQKNSVLYFQFGLILCLLGTFGLFEMRFESKLLKPDVTETVPETVEYTMDKYKIYEPEKKVERKKVSKQLPTEVKDVPNDSTEPDPTEFIDPEDNTTNEKPIDPEDLTPVVDIPDEVHAMAVEFVPVFPGCEKFELNSQRKKCLNEKIGRLVQKKFDTDIASEYGLQGIQRIFVEFKVDTTGEITDIKTRAPHPKLEAEALRLANKIPKMQPGKMGTTPVNVIYNLPITFKVQD